jgi:hypothetical protein
MVTRDWRARAACRDVDPEMFFPVAEAGTPAGDVAILHAKRVCRGCPVRAECLTFALEVLPYGIAGGLTADERRALRRFHRKAG